MIAFASLLAALDEILFDKSDLAFLQREDLALLNLMTVKIAVACSEGNLSGGDTPGGAGHRQEVLIGILLGVKGEHRRKALRNCLGLEHNDLPVSEADRLFRGHNNVLVVGQHKTVCAPTDCTAERISSVEGFIVCPPETT